MIISFLSFYIRKRYLFIFCEVHLQSFPMASDKIELVLNEMPVAVEDEPKTVQTPTEKEVKRIQFRVFQNQHIFPFTNLTLHVHILVIVKIYFNLIPHECLVSLLHLQLYRVRGWDDVVTIWDLIEVPQRTFGFEHILLIAQTDQKQVLTTYYFFSLNVTS